MKTIRILCAADRNNYGDLLFPHIITEYLKLRGFSKIVNYGIQESNLSSFKALPTRSIVCLKKDIKANDVIVIAGGEVLGGGWLNILRFMNTLWNKVFHTRIFRGILNKSGLMDTMQFFRTGSSKPFILDSNIYEKAIIFYNSVGALGINRLLQDEKYVNYFKHIAHLSVRDHVSSKKISKHRIEHSLVPDSAILMSDLMSPFLKENISQDCKDFTKEKFIFLQFGNNKGPDDLDKFTSELKQFSQKNKLKVILCPIGLALDHDDEIILKKINSLENTFLYYKPKNLYETMYLIKKTQLYLGTSLHGFLTAQSYNRPFFVFDEKVNKNEQYIDTWNVATTKCFGGFHDFDLIQTRIEKFDENSEKIKTETQKEYVYDNLNKILNYV